VANDKYFFIFPGQGSQYRGMGTDLVAEFPAADAIYQRANDAMSFDLRRLSFEDPDGELGLTRFTQPALLTHEIACLEAFKSLVGSAVAPALVAGHSLGEYSALVACGCLEFESALKLVAKRGELMSKYGAGGMLATTLDMDSAYVLADRHFCGIGGCNLPDQTVIAGEHADLDALIVDMAETFPGKRAIKLDTEGAFHTHLMVEAARQFRAVLEDVEFSEPICPVLSNYTGKLHDHVSEGIRSRLFFQLFNPVRWFACLNVAFELGVNPILEFGGGIGKSPEPASKRPNLEGIVKKSLKFADYEAQYLPAVNAATIRAAAELLAAR
jgi:[acyl-carrier-protein] S-malonyltransferase